MSRTPDARANELALKLKECAFGRESDREQRQKDREKIVKELGFEFNTGFILTLSRGSSTSIDNQVQFESYEGDGWSSTWPDWAYQIAREAMLYRRKVSIVSEGPPFGSNLVLVTILLDNA